MDDFDDEIFRLFDDEDEEPDPTPDPSWRATIRRGRLTITGWAPWLFSTGGAVGGLFRERERNGVTIADLIADDEDLTVRLLAAGGNAERAGDLLVEWAGHVGYRRVWLPDRLVTLEPDPGQIGTAHVRCPTCRGSWREGSPEFWLMIRERKCFPNWCPLCGGELANWEVEPPAEARTPTRRKAADGEWSTPAGKPRTRQRRR